MRSSKESSTKLPLSLALMERILDTVVESGATRGEAKAAIEGALAFVPILGLPPTPTEILGA